MADACPVDIVIRDFYLCDLFVNEISLETRWCIIGACGILIEVANQVTYQISKTNRGVASTIKCFLFWGIIAAGTSFYAALSELDASLSQFPSLSAIMIYLVLAWVLPNYSVSPEFRFLFLRGSFRKNEKIAQ